MTTTKLAFLTTCLTSSLLLTCGADEECHADKYSPASVNLYIGSHRNSTGDWVTSFNISKGDTDAEGSSNVTLNLSQDVAECRGKRILHIRGVLSGLSSSFSQGYRNSKKKDLLFHDKCGSNVAILNNGLQARKINFRILTQYRAKRACCCLHSSPLEINETLEVKLDVKHNKFTHCLAIGVTTASPMDFPQILQHINSIKNKSWAWYISNTYQNGEMKLKNYGKSLDDMNVGDRAAVKRSNTGGLHFYFNGVDQGPAFSNIPHPVYGVVELYGNAAMATIVED